MRLSSLQARRLAIHAQGLDGALPTTTPTRRQLRRAMSNLGVLQIDAVNAIARSHLLVLRARVGGEHDQVRELLDRTAYQHGELAEYWCHEACFVPVEDWHLFQWRMNRAAEGQMYKSLVQFKRDRQDLLDGLLDHITEHGSVTAGQLEPGARKGPWWGWSDTKTALEILFWTGDVTVCHRENFTRHYDRSDRVLGPHAAPSPLTEDEAHHELLLRAARHLGVGAAEDLIDYHRLPKKPARDRLAELVDQGALIEAEVEGWSRPGYVLPGTIPRRRRSRSVLVSPFDPIVWFRPRAERLFDFEYRIEIYVPAPKRVYGYYVLPFLHDDRLRARVDLKADRAEGILRAHGVFGEAGHVTDDTVEALAVELWRLADFLGLGTVEIGDRGDLRDATARAISSSELKERAGAARWDS